MDTIASEAAKAAEKEARKQAGTDATPLGDVAEGAVTVTEIVTDGTLSAVIEGVGSVLGGAVEVVGGILGGLGDL